MKYSKYKEHTKKYAKYIDALSQMDEIINIVELDLIGKMRKDMEETDAYDLVHTKWDELYTFIFANFKEPVTRFKRVWESKSQVSDSQWEQLKKENLTNADQEELDSMNEMFKLAREELEEQLYEIPPVILEQCFPVWIARYLLGERSCPVLPSRLATFDEFHNNYGFMVLNAN